MVSGVAWALFFYSAIVIGFVSEFSREKADVVMFVYFLLVGAPVMSSPGVLCAVFGLMLHRDVTSDSIKFAMGGLAVMATFVLLILLAELFVLLIPSDYAFSVSVMFAVPLSVLMYVLLTQWLLRLEGFEVPLRAQLVSNVVLVVVTYSVWMLSKHVLSQSRPDAIRSDLEAARLLAPIFLSGAFFLVAYHLRNRLLAGVIIPPPFPPSTDGS